MRLKIKSSFGWMIFLLGLLLVGCGGGNGGGGSNSLASNAAVNPALVALLANQPTYSEAAYSSAWTDGAIVMDPEPVDLTRDDENYHSEVEITFEGWVFTAQLEDGTSITVTLMPKNVLMPKAVMSSIYVLDSEERASQSSYEFTTSDFTYVSDTLDIMADDSEEDCAAHIFYTGTEWRVVFKHEHAYADLIFTPEVSAMRAGNGRIFSSGAAEINWTAIAPRAKVTGRVKTENISEIAVNGYGYADHVWGKGLPLNAYRALYMSRVFTENYTLILMQAKAESESGGGIVTSNMLLAAQGADPLLSSSAVSITLSEEQWEDEVQQSYPERCEAFFTTATQDFSLSLASQSLDLKETVDAMEQAKDMGIYSELIVQLQTLYPKPAFFMVSGQGEVTVWQGEETKTESGDMFLSSLVLK